MRILLLTDYGRLTGGVEVTTQQLGAGLRDRGHDVQWFASSADTGGGEVIADHVCAGTASRWRTLLQTANPMAARSLARVLDEFRPDVVHVGMFLTQLSPLILTKLRKRRIPSVYFVQWFRPVCPTGIKLLPDGTPCAMRSGLACYSSGCLPLRDVVPLTIQMKLWRRWSDAFDVLIANSRATQTILAAEGLECQEVIHSGVPLRPARPGLTGPPTIAYAGRLVPEKGVDVLIRAVARIRRDGGIPEARLIVVGDGPQRAELECLVTQLSLSDAVRFTGHVPRSSVDDLFAGAWVQAAPSVWAEPFGLVAPESMMRGTAIVATTGGGMSETVQDGKWGFLVPPGQVDPLADALAKILRDRDLAERMGAAGRGVAITRYSTDVMVSEFERVYREVIASREAAGADGPLAAPRLATRARTDKPGVSLDARQKSTT